MEATVSSRQTKLAPLSADQDAAWDQWFHRKDQEAALDQEPSRGTTTLPPMRSDSSAASSSTQNASNRTAGPPFEDTAPGLPDERTARIADATVWANDPFERKSASAPPALVDNPTYSRYFTAYSTYVSTAAGARVTLLGTKLAKEGTIQALKSAPRTNDGKQRLCRDNSCHRGCISPAGKCAHSHKLIIAVKDFHWVLQAEFLRRGGFKNGKKTKAADADERISLLRGQARRDMAGQQGRITNTTSSHGYLNQNLAFTWTTVPRHYREGDHVYEGTTPLEPLVPNLSAAPRDFFANYQAPGVDYGDLLTYDDDETMTSILGLEPGTPERRQCLLLATAAAVLWAQLPRQDPHDRRGARACGRHTPGTVPRRQKRLLNVERVNSKARPPRGKPSAARCTT